MDCPVGLSGPMKSDLTWDMQPEHLLSIPTGLESVSNESRPCNAAGDDLDDMHIAEYAASLMR